MYGSQKAVLLKKSKAVLLKNCILCMLKKNNQNLQKGIPKYLKASDLIVYTRDQTKKEPNCVMVGLLPMFDLIITIMEFL